MIIIELDLILRYGSLSRVVFSLPHPFLLHLLFPSPVYYLFRTKRERERERKEREREGKRKEREERKRDLKLKGSSSVRIEKNADGTENERMLKNFQIQT